MRRALHTSIFIVASFLLMDFDLWSQERAIVTQGEIAELIGARFGFKEEPMRRLKGIGVTPLGEWEPEKSLTKDDLDAILIRIARRDPVVEKMEPAKLIDSMGFPPRDVSQEGIKVLLESDAFRRVMINLKLFLSAGIMPLPHKYIKIVETIAEGAEKGAVAAAPLAAAPAAPISIGPVTGPGPGPGPGGPFDPGDPPPPGGPPEPPPSHS